MKKMNILKFAFTFVLAVSFSMAFGQAMDANLTVDQTTDQYVTVNKAMPYYVEPDSYFNPNYTSGGGWTVTSDFAWSFSTTPVGATPNISDATVINPDITLDVVGDYVLDVQETSADGCAGTVRQLNIHVLGVPTADFSAADVENCGDYTGAVNVDIADNSATNFLVDYTVTAQNYLADKVTPDGAVISSNSTTDVAFAAPGNAQELIASATYAVQNNKVTRYTITIDGVNDAVSRVSDYIAPNGRAWPIATFTEYPALTDGTYIITVLPSPTTGPIYHIPN